MTDRAALDIHFLVVFDGDFVVNHGNSSFLFLLHVIGPYDLLQLLRNIAVTIYFAASAFSCTGMLPGIRR